MTMIVVQTETCTWQTRPRDPIDTWDQGDSAGKVSNVTAHVQPDADETRNWGDSMAKDLDVSPGDTVYAVVADYESGSTFGRDGGYAQIVDVFTDRLSAAELAKAALAEPKSDSYYDRYGFTYAGKEYRKSWEGYFESLQSLDIWEVTVRDSSQTFLTPEDERSYGFKTGN